MQISNVEIFAFVEGGLDRSFAEKILCACGIESHKFRVSAIKEITGETGGKQAVLHAFKKARQQGNLCSKAWGKKFVQLFFLDKDADDLLRKKCRSPHLLYTPTYDIEGTLFYFGNLIKAFSEACLITTQQAAAIIGDAKKWLKEISCNWADWITLCLISQQKKINLGFTFDRTSIINPEPLNAVDTKKLDQCKTDFAKKLNMSRSDFENYYQKMARKVLFSIAKEEPLKYFKGKWLSFLLQKKVESHTKIEDSNTNSVGDRTYVALLTQVATNENCAFLQYYKPSIIYAINTVA